MTVMSDITEVLNKLTNSDIKNIIIESRERDTNGVLPNGVVITIANEIHNAANKLLDVASCRQMVINHALQKAAYEWISFIDAEIMK